MKKLTIVDNSSGEIVEDIEFSGGYSIQYATNENDGRINIVSKLDNAKFGYKHWIKNGIYRPLAVALKTKFKELSHIRPERILFIEDVEWENKSPSKKTWIARIQKTNNQFSEMTGYNYILETRKWFIDQFSREQLALLLYHKLMHIDTDGTLRTHDVEDWNNIIATFGTHWNKPNAVIDNILDKAFDGWDKLKEHKKQMTLYDLMGK